MRYRAIPKNTLPYIIEVDTTLTGGTSSPSNTFVLPLPVVSGYKCRVNWGDGNYETVLSGGNLTHTYTSGGTYEIKVRGQIAAIIFNSQGDKIKLKKVKLSGLRCFLNQKTNIKNT